jgi:hypothetical protein
LQARTLAAGHDKGDDLLAHGHPWVFNPGNRA